MKLGYLSLVLCTATASYLPPTYKGTPVSVGVVSLDPPDYRGEESYRIEFSLQAEKDMPQEGLVHRSWADFQKFDYLLTMHLLNFGLHFPTEPSVENLDEYLNHVMNRTTTLLSPRTHLMTSLASTGMVQIWNFFRIFLNFSRLLFPHCVQSPSLSSRTSSVRHGDGCDYLPRDTVWDLDLSHCLQISAEHQWLSQLLQQFSQHLPWLHRWTWWLRCSTSRSHHRHASSFQQHLCTLSSQRISQWSHSQNSLWHI